jgi:hypothetical protein
MVAKEIAMNSNVLPGAVKINDGGAYYPLYCNKHLMEACNADILGSVEWGVKKKDIQSAERWVSRANRMKLKRHKPTVEVKPLPFVTIDNTKPTRGDQRNTVHRLRIKARVRDEYLLREILEFVNDFKNKTLPASTSINLELL